MSDRDKIYEVFLNMVKEWVKKGFNLVEVELLSDGYLNANNSEHLVPLWSYWLDDYFTTQEQVWTNSEEDDEDGEV